MKTNKITKHQAIRAFSTLRKYFGEGGEKRLSSQEGLDKSLTKLCKKYGCSIENGKPRFISKYHYAFEPDIINSEGSKILSFRIDDRGYTTTFFNNSSESKEMRKEVESLKNSKEWEIYIDEFKTLD